MKRNFKLFTLLILLCGLVVPSLTSCNLGNNRRPGLDDSSNPDINFPDDGTDLPTPNPDEGGIDVPNPDLKPNPDEDKPHVPNPGPERDPQIEAETYFNFNGVETTINSATLNYDYGSNIRIEAITLYERGVSSPIYYEESEVHTFNNLKSNTYYKVEIVYSEIDTNLKRFYYSEFFRTEIEKPVFTLKTFEVKNNTVNYEYYVDKTKEDYTITGFEARIYKDGLGKFVSTSEKYTFVNLEYHAEYIIQFVYTYELAGYDGKSEIFIDERPFVTGSPVQDEFIKFDKLIPSYNELEFSITVGPDVTAYIVSVVDSTFTTVDYVTVEGNKIYNLLPSSEYQVEVEYRTFDDPSTPQFAYSDIFYTLPEPDKPKPLPIESSVTFIKAEPVNDMISFYLKMEANDCAINSCIVYLFEDGATDYCNQFIVDGSTSGVFIDIKPNTTYLLRVVYEYYNEQIGTNNKSDEITVVSNNFVSKNYENNKAIFYDINTKNNEISFNISYPTRFKPLKFELVSNDNLIQTIDASKRNFTNLDPNLTYKILAYFEDEFVNEQVFESESVTVYKDSPLRLIPKLNITNTSVTFDFEIEKLLSAIELPYYQASLLDQNYNLIKTISLYSRGTFDNLIPGTRYYIESDYTYRVDGTFDSNRRGTCLTKFDTSFDADPIFSFAGFERKVNELSWRVNLPPEALIKKFKLYEDNVYKYDISSRDTIVKNLDSNKHYRIGAVYSVNQGEDVEVLSGDVMTLAYSNYYRFSELHTFKGKVFYKVDKNLLKDRELTLKEVRLLINPGEYTCTDYSGCFEFDEYIENTKSIIQICGTEKTINEELNVQSSTDFYVTSKQKLIVTARSDNSFTYDASTFFSNKGYQISDFKLEVFNYNNKIAESTAPYATLSNLSGYGPCTFYISATVKIEGSNINYRFTYKEVLNF